jgi:hypothetical protein
MKVKQAYLRFRVSLEVLRHLHLLRSRRRPTHRDDGHASGTEMMTHLGVIRLPSFKIYGLASVLVDRLKHAVKRRVRYRTARDMWA